MFSRQFKENLYGVPHKLRDFLTVQCKTIVLSFGDTNDERIEEAVDELQERRLHE